MGSEAGPERLYELEVKRMFADAAADVERELTPLRDIGLAIVRASVSCRDRTKAWMKPEAEPERLKREINLYFEFLYFFMHMTLRKAFGRLTESQLASIQDFLAALIPGIAIDSYFLHWPASLKEKMAEEFADNLNNAEAEYAELGRSGDMTKVLLGLIKHVIDALGRDDIDQSAVSEMLRTTIGELEAMDMTALLASVR